MVQEALDIVNDAKPNNVLLEVPPLPKAALDTVKTTIDHSISKV